MAGGTKFGIPAATFRGPAEKPGSSLTRSGNSSALPQRAEDCDAKSTKRQSSQTGQNPVSSATVKFGGSVARKETNKKRKEQLESLEADAQACVKGFQRAKAINDEAIVLHRKFKEVIAEMRPVFERVGCWTLTIVLAQILFAVPRILSRKIAITTAGALLFCVCFQSLVREQWREEKAATLTGELCSFRSFWGTCYTPPVPLIQIGDSGSEIFWAGPGAMQMGEFANNVGFRIEQGKHGIELSTPLLDRSGRKIAEIEKNHWTVIPQPGIWDKNYTQNSLEILDSREQVVLQIRFLSDRIQIAAEWRDQFGRGQEWSKCANSNQACISPWGSPQTELQNEVVIQPIFKYPSSEYLGEFVK